MATTPSPSKKAMQPSASPAPTQPGDFRKSFQREASTGFEDVIRQRAVDSRHNVNRGYGLGQGVQPPRSGGGSGRPLTQTQSMPVLSFAQQDSVFRTSNDVLNATFGDGHVTEYRTREVQPMWATPPSPASSQGRGLRRHPSAGSASTSMVWPAPSGGAGAATAAMSAFSTPAATGPGGGDDGGDGFDLDEVFGPSGGDHQLGAAISIDDDSQRTVTQGIKRGFFETEEGMGEAEDEEMALTDVEDDEMPSALPKARPTAGNRRVLGRTQSVPASAFRGEYQF
ncbi:BZ3500_MvSof-1268-A1-R1_Chr4-4g07449 [Microbotryum saponariae]|uniref:BZ3500_MvSof-1268-A1-R1_Chr4-4g07449 protein n=1 Tax=Microbotryum saponariae TaxID=289078 RepID=A0A2X0LNZ3_9BASI|nr:BZ3500_MvSof-1268-A1-R1_Chr4-4g07449 [Microbotryum saponariae]SDA07110.1 BZ3501_MvSof-1269-A2-R1_Chr4-3g07157 [Microbotryum saponariae]